MSGALGFHIDDETVAVGDVRDRLPAFVDAATQRPGHITRFGRHRKAEAALMSTETLRAIFDRLEHLEADLLAAQATAILLKGGTFVPSEEVEPGYVPPTPDEAAAAAAAFRTA